MGIVYLHGCVCVCAWRTERIRDGSYVCNAHFVTGVAICMWNTCYTPPRQPRQMHDSTRLRIFAPRGIWIYRLVQKKRRDASRGAVHVSPIRAGKHAASRSHGVKGCGFVHTCITCERCLGNECRGLTHARGARRVRTRVRRSGWVGDGCVRRCGRGCTDRIGCAWRGRETCMLRHVRHVQEFGGTVTCRHKLCIFIHVSRVHAPWMTSHDDRQARLRECAGIF